jgi:hypothetical protein
MLISGKHFTCHEKPPSYNPFSATLVANVVYETNDGVLYISGMRYKTYLTQFLDTSMYKPEDWDDADIVRKKRKKWYFWGEEIDYWYFKNTWACLKEKEIFRMSTSHFVLDESNIKEEKLLLE